MHSHFTDAAPAMKSHFTRRRFLTAAGIAALSGCLGRSDGPPEEATPDDADPATVTGTDRSPPLASHALPLPQSGEQLSTEVLSGGPPKDGIPSIDDPQFVDADATGGFLSDGDVVIGVSRGESAKAYPQKILVQHEIVNDVVAGDPVSVTYCPLTGTAQGFARGETTFGVSGRLLNNNLVMYDRATENWWPQILSTAIPGPWGSNLAGESLAEFRVIWTTWGQWRAKHSNTKVLSTDTGYARNYNRDPYGQYNPKGGYYTNDRTLFPRLNPDDRFGPKRLVMGVRSPEGAASVPKDVLREAGLVEGAIGDRSLLWVYDADLDTAHAYWNPDDVDFSYRDGSVAGPDGTHEPTDLPLDPAVTFDAMWFAWSGFYPDGSVHG